MLPPLKLNSIDQEHLQELYDASAVARDQLPYTEAFDTVWQGFQDRTFKNAEREQVFGAMIKYVRSAGNSSLELPAGALTEDQLKQLKQMLPRHAKGGNILPYSDEFNAVRAEFKKLAGVDMTEQDFWRAIMRTRGAKRKPPTRAKKPVEAAADTEDDGE